MDIETLIEQLAGENSDGDQDLGLPFPIHRASFPRNHVLTRYGQIETKGYFLRKGIVQCSVQKDGEERIIDFVFPGNFVTAYNSFVLDTPSDIEVSTLSECEVAYFFKADVKKRYEDSLIANKLGRYIKEKVLMEKLRKEKELLTNSAEENYRELLKNRPEVIENIPIHKIAKYLGIHPESLSRIRARVIS
ncbi:Crp/Fnr family transcriptional regulator [Flagellimonas aequoris]|nr:Crp/Fnr family transcriptional regulator [Allomuricauda aequoris]TXK07537.1 Crp/Fnr family transcriptional regulator [Allomuricauda aequoris]